MLMPPVLCEFGNFDQTLFTITELTTCFYEIGVVHPLTLFITNDFMDIPSSRFLHACAIVKKIKNKKNIMYIFQPDLLM